MDLVSLAIEAAALVAALAIHESAHALAAYALGDATARERGRVSLSPLAHVDPFGSVVLPLIMLATGGPVIAFAKPVPVYLGNLRHPKRDEVLVSAAGPASNIVLACLASLLLRLLAGSTLGATVLVGSGALGTAALVLARFLVVSISLNLSLAFFNLIPLPPLDGSSILVPFLRGRALARYHQVRRYAMPILLTVLYLLPTTLHIDLVGMYLDAIVYPLASRLLSFAIG